MTKEEALKRASGNLRNAQEEVEADNPIGKPEAQDRLEFWKTVVAALEQAIMNEKMSEAMDSIVQACMDGKKGGGTA